MSDASGPSRRDTPGPSRRIGLGARHARRVTPEHVGQRVSLRRWVTDPDRGPVQSDVVGRLLAFEEGVLLLVDRAHQLHTVGEADVLSSRVVPPHPRLQDEPHVGAPDAPLEREAARVLLVDATRRVLLVSHLASADHRVWTAPGGGVAPGEDHPTAARRELREELDVELAPGPCVWTRDVTFAFHGVWIRQRERWFLADADPHGRDPTAAPPADVGTEEARWWSLAELRATRELLAPRALADHLAALLRDGPPATPVDVGD